MSQDSDPRFSHIRVGSAVSESPDQGDEESVIVIGPATLAAEDDITSAAGERGLSPEVVPDEIVEKGASTGSTTSLQHQGITEDDLQVSAMPLLQKLILAACAIAFIIAIFLVAWYRFNNG